MYIIFYILNQYANIIIIQRILFRVQPTTFDYTEIYNLALYMKGLIKRCHINPSVLKTKALNHKIFSNFSGPAIGPSARRSCPLIGRGQITFL